MTDVIEIKNVKKRFKMGDETLEVLKGVSLNVKKNDFIAILGPSGSGKSTLMNIIGCMDKFQDGEYNLMGVPIKKMNDDNLTLIRNKYIGFIFQKYHLIPKYTVIQNVMMPLLVRGMSHDKAMEIAYKQLKLLEMENRLFHKPSELSGGQQQRVAIARALIGQPKLLLADEPTGALDAKTGAEVLKLFHQLNEMGHTIVMITHDLEVAKHAKKIVRIIDGNLYQDDMEEEIPQAG